MGVPVSKDGLLHPGASPRVHRQHDVPAEIRALDRLGSDYLDLFVAPVADASAHTAEEWARATIEGASATGRFVAWRVLCALRLPAASPTDHIAGWRVVGRTDRWIRVEARGPFMTANMIFVVDEETVSFATLVRYDNPVGRLVWTPVSAIHRSVAPDFLAGGIRRLR